jgi:hypothetical protein
MARIIIPISLSLMGGGMPWTLQGELTTEWATATVTSPYVRFGYVEPDYFVDEEWTLAAEPDQTWTLVPA